MWDGAEALVQYGSGAAIAAGALLYQQRRTDRREDMRIEREAESRAAEKAASEAAAAAAQKAALLERWRDERLAAHAHLLDLLRDEYARCVQNFMTLSSAREDRFESVKAQLQISHDVGAAVARVELVGSPAAAQAASLAYKQIVTSNHAAFLMVLNFIDQPAKPLDDKSAFLRETIDAYRQAARKDLEVD